MFRLKNPFLEVRPMATVSWTIAKAKESEVAQSCLTLWDPVDCSPPGSSVHGILQARVLEWLPFLLQGIFPTQGSNPGLPHCRQMLYHPSNQRSAGPYGSSKPPLPSRPPSSGRWQPVSSPRQADSGRRQRGLNFQGQSKQGGLEESPKAVTTVPDTRESQPQELSAQACDGWSWKFRTLGAWKRTIPQNFSRALPKQLVLDRLIQVWGGNSLTVLRLECHASTHGKWVRFLVWKLRFLVPYDVAKKKKKRKKSKFDKIAPILLNLLRYLIIPFLI